MSPKDSPRGIVSLTMADESSGDTFYIPPELAPRNILAPIVPRPRNRWALLKRLALAVIGSILVAGSEVFEWYPARSLEVIRSNPNIGLPLLLLSAAVATMGLVLLGVGSLRAAGVLQSHGRKHGSPGHTRLTPQEVEQFAKRYTPFESNGIRWIPPIPVRAPGWGKVPEALAMVLGGCEAIVTIPTVLGALLGFYSWDWSSYLTIQVAIGITFVILIGIAISTRWVYDQFGLSDRGVHLQAERRELVIPWTKVEGVTLDLIPQMYQSARQWRFRYRDPTSGRRTLIGRNNEIHPEWVVALIQDPHCPSFELGETAWKILGIDPPASWPRPPDLPNHGS